MTMKSHTTSVAPDDTDDEHMRRGQAISLFLGDAAKLIASQTGAGVVVIICAGPKGSGTIISGTTGDVDSMTQVQDLLRRHADSIGNPNAVKIPAEPGDKPA